MSEIAKNISKVGEWDTAMMYKADCTCTHENHQQTIEVEYDKEFNDINMTIYSPYFTPRNDFYWRKDADFLEAMGDWFKVQGTKIKWIWSILTKGHIEVQSHFTLNGEEQVRDYVKALNEGLDRTVKHKGG